MCHYTKEESILKPTGIVRRLDDLGRIVIPKEIRRTLRIREGDPLEIFTDRDGEIILKKYCPIGELGIFAKEYTDSLHQTTSHVVCLIDKDEIISVSGAPKKNFIGKPVSKKLTALINGRIELTASKDDVSFAPIFDDDSISLYTHQHITPIICEGDVLGAVLFLSENKNMGALEEKLAQTCALFLSKQMEQ